MHELAVKPKCGKCQEQTKTGNCVEHQYGALPRKAKIDQPMMDVLPVGAKERQSFQSAAQQSQTNVQNRQSQGEQRRDQSRSHRAFAGIENRENADQKTEQIRAAIAHVNSRWRKVVV